MPQPELLLTCHECAGEYELTGMDFSHQPPSYEYICRTCDRSLTVAVSAEAAESQCAALQQENEALKAQVARDTAESDAVFHAAMRALDGEPVSDFEASFPLVRKAIDTYERGKHKDRAIELVVEQSERLALLTASVEKLVEDLRVEADRLSDLSNEPNDPRLPYARGYDNGQAWGNRRVADALAHVLPEKKQKNDKADTRVDSLS